MSRFYSAIICKNHISLFLEFTTKSTLYSASTAHFTWDRLIQKVKWDEEKEGKKKNNFFFNLDFLTFTIILA